MADGDKYQPVVRVFRFKLTYKLYIHVVPKKCIGLVIVPSPRPQALPDVARLFFFTIILQVPKLWLPCSCMRNA